METTIEYWGYKGILEKRMEPTIVYYKTGLVLLYRVGSPTSS